MTIVYAPKAWKQIQKLPSHIQKKAFRQFETLLNNPNHPSLHVKKKEGSREFEGRIDIHYRFSFVIESKTVLVLTIGMHDFGLGKK